MKRKQENSTVLFTEGFRYFFDYSEAEKDNGRFVIKIFVEGNPQFVAGEYFADTFATIETGSALHMRGGTLTANNVVDIQRAIRELTTKDADSHCYRLNISGIIKALRVDSHTASLVESAIDHLIGLDYSECSTVQFNRAAREAYAALIRGDVYKRA